MKRFQVSKKQSEASERTNERTKKTYSDWLWSHYNNTHAEKYVRISPWLCVLLAGTVCAARLSIILGYFLFTFFWPFHRYTFSSPPWMCLCARVRLYSYAAHVSRQLLCSHSGRTSSQERSPIGMALRCAWYFVYVFAIESQRGFEFLSPASVHRTHTQAHRRIPHKRTRRHDFETAHAIWRLANSEGRRFTPRRAQNLSL